METTPTTKTPAEILECAADLIETHGLARRAFQNSKGAHCSLGAIRECGLGDPYAYPWFETPTDTAERALADAVGWIPGWNDNTKRRPSTIVRTIRRVAAKLRVEEAAAAALTIPRAGTDTSEV